MHRIQSIAFASCSLLLSSFAPRKNGRTLLSRSERRHLCIQGSFQSVSIACLVCLVLAFPAQAFAVTVEKMESSVADVEERMNSARARFVKKLESAKVKVRQAKMGSEEKRACLKTIDSELTVFKQSSLLPDHPLHIGLSYDFSRNVLLTIGRAEETRLRIIEATNRGSTDLSLSELAKLESRLDRVLSSTATWNSGDRWHGKRVYPVGSAQGLELRIHTVTGSQFTGVLIQWYANGTSDEMHVAGQRVGSNFSMQTTGMKLGAASFLKFNGVVIGKQILPNISGVAVSGKRASGLAGLRIYSIVPHRRPSRQTNESA